MGQVLTTPAVSITLFNVSDEDVYLSPIPENLYFWCLFYFISFTYIYLCCNLSNLGVNQPSKNRTIRLLPWSLREWALIQ